MFRVSIELAIAPINQWLMCLQQDETQAFYVGLLSGLGNRCWNISCEGRDGHVFAQDLDLAGDAKDVCVSCPRHSGLGNRCIECLVEGSGQLCVFSSGPLPLVIQQMTIYRCGIIMIAPGGQGCLGFGSVGSVHKIPSKWVNLLTQLFSNRLHNNLAYLNLHV